MQPLYKRKGQTLQEMLLNGIISKMKEFFLKMFTAHSGLSSKRVCGFFG
jgi:hypothetical protein